jgi:PhnB protein
MSAKRCSAYLKFNGQAADAIRLYESALGAEVKAIMRFGDVDAIKTPPELKDRIMHSEIKIGESTVMISDAMPGRPQPEGAGRVEVLIDFDTPESMAQSFQALSNQGEVVMPIEDTFWGAKFGVLVDPFGITWLLHHAKGAAAQA